MMGWSAAEVGRSSVWKLMAAFTGFRRFHEGPAKPEPPSDEEFDRAVREARGG